MVNNNSTNHLPYAPVRVINQDINILTNGDIISMK